MTRLAFGRSPYHLFHLALGRAAGRGALGFGSGLLARRPLCFLAFFFAQFLSIGHELSRELFGIESNSINQNCSLLLIYGTKIDNAARHKGPAQYTPYRSRPAGSEAERAISNQG